MTNIDEQFEPSITIRHDTANMAAISVAELRQDEAEQQQVTSIDDEVVFKALGPQLSHEHDSSDEDGEGLRTPSSPERAPTPLETEETVVETVNQKGNVEVVTSVTVVAMGDPDRDSTGRKSESPISLESDKQSRKSSGVSSMSPDLPVATERKTSEVTLTNEERALMVHVAMDSSDTSSSEEDEGIKPESETKPEDNEASPVPSTPPIITVDKTDTLKREGATENGKENGSDSEKDSLAPAPKPRQGRRGMRWVDLFPN